MAAKATESTESTRSAKSTKSTRKKPVNFLPMLQLAARPGARFLLIAGKAFIINGKDHTHTYVRDTLYKALREEDLISSPRQIAPDLAESGITHTGRARLAAIEAHRRKYTQLVFTL